MIVLGLDLAPRLSGWTCGNGVEVPACDVWRLPEVGADYGAHLSALKGYLDVTFSRFPDIGAVGYESPILVTKGRGKGYGDKLSTLRLIYPMGSFVEWYCTDIAKVPCHEITLQDGKSEITGNHAAEKEDIAKIAERCGLTLPKVGRLDASDSWSIWKCLLRHYDPDQSARWDALIWGSRGGLL